MTPLVSIGITAFNAAGHVGRAIASALAQDWRPIEIILVDDASGDGTAAAVEALAARHPEIRLMVNGENAGVAAARSRLVGEARGEFLVFFDDDDVSAPGRVAAQLRRILDYERAHPGAMVVCHTAREQHYPDGRVRIERTMGENAGPAPAGEAVAHRILTGAPLENGYGSLASCSLMARTAVFRGLGGFDPAFRRSEDTDFCVRAARAGAHFVGVGTPLVMQTMTWGSDKTLERERQYALMLIDKHREVFANEAEYRFARAWMGLKHDWLAGRRGVFARRLAGLALAHPVLAARRLSMALPRMQANRFRRRFHRTGPVVS